MPYCTPTEFRKETQISENIISDADLTEMIVFSDRKLDRDSLTEADATDLKQASIYLTLIRVFNLPTMRGGFSAPGITITQEDVEKRREHAQKIVDDIYAYYGKLTPVVVASEYETIDED